MFSTAILSITCIFTIQGHIAIYDGKFDHLDAVRVGHIVTYPNMFSPMLITHFTLNDLGARQIKIRISQMVCKTIVVFLGYSAWTTLLGRGEGVVQGQLE